MLDDLCVNRVNLYVFTGEYDDQGGVDAPNSYPGSPTRSGIPCSVQLISTDRADDQNGRVSVVNTYEVDFATDPGVKLLDKLTWGSRILFCQGEAVNNAGHSMSYTVHCQEPR